jgi:hypothetical protein
LADFNAIWQIARRLKERTDPLISEPSGGRKHPLFSAADRKKTQSKIYAFLCAFAGNNFFSRRGAKAQRI